MKGFWHRGKKWAGVLSGGWQAFFALWPCSMVKYGEAWCTIVFLQKQQTFCVFAVSKCFDYSLPEEINTRYEALFTINICFSAGQTRAAKFQHHFESSAHLSSPMLLYKSSKPAESITFIFLSASQACIHLANVENFIFI